jgi:hypothetical protein
MTAIEPLERPSAADLETALRRALVSPDSVPGEVADEHTRMLPALPSRPPSTVLPNAALQAAAQQSAGVPSAGAHSTAPEPVASLEETRGTGGRRRRSRRIWLASAAAAAALLAAATAVTFAVSTPGTPDVVTYPTVTGTLGDHLVELQKSVEP